MANSFVRYTGNGSTTAFAIPFTYINSTHLACTVNGVSTSFTLNAAGTTATISPAPASASSIEFRRATSQNARLTDYVSGAVLTETDLDTDSTQGFYLGQEAIDDANDKISLDSADFQWDANSKRIKNVAAPTADTDAVNKSFISTNLPNITTVSGIAANVTTVAGIQANVTTVAGNNANVTTVASNIASVNTVAGDITKVVAVANDLAEAVSEVETVANDLNEATSEIDTVATSITNVDAVGTNIANVNTVAGISSNVTTVAGVSSNVAAVGGIAANVTTVAGIASDVTAVAGDATDIGAVAAKATEIGRLGTADAVADMVLLGTTDAVADMNTLGTAGNVTNMNTLAGISSNITTAASNNANITTVAGISANVTTVAGVASNITTAATNNANITTVAGAITNVNNVGGSIANVNTVAGNLAGVTSFAERYRVASSYPASSNDAGDLAFNTSASTFGYYDGSNWQSITAGGITSLAGDATPQLGGDLDINSHDITGTGNINITGGVTMSGNLTVNGTTTTINSTTMTVDDKNMVLASGAADSSAADGSGITIDGASAELKYVHSGTKWTVNKDFDVTGNIIVSGTVDGVDIAALNTTVSGIEANATADQTDAEIRAAVEAATDSNVFTDADHTKLNGIATGAEVNVQSDWNSSSGDNQILNKPTIPAAVGGASGVDFNDNVKARFGTTDNDLEIYHDGSNSYVKETGTGGLILAGSNDVTIKNAGLDETMAVFTVDGASELYWNSSKKLETTTDGVDVSGTLGVISAKDLGVGIHIKSADSGASSVSGDADELVIEGSTNAGISILGGNGNACRIYFGDDGDNDIGFINYAHDTNSMIFGTNAATRLTIDSSGNGTFTGNVTAYSDERLKDNIKTIDNALDKVSQMRGVAFQRKDTRRKDSGVIAQELEKVAPELVIDGEYKSVAYGNIVGYLIEAIKELKAEVKELKEAK